MPDMVACRLEQTYAFPPTSDVVHICFTCQATVSLCVATMIALYSVLIWEVIYGQFDFQHALKH